MNKYGISLKSTNQKEKENFCLDCGKSIYPDSIRCISCENKKRKTNIIEREELKQLIRTIPFVKIGEMYGVSDSAVRKWCKAKNLPHTKTDINSYTDEEWASI